VGRIVVTEFVSLDGVMEDPGGSESFRHGGWTFKIDRGEEGDKFKLDEALASDALLLGRVTYEGFAAAWPSREGEFADKFNTMPKYVVSSTLQEPEWNNSTVLNGDVTGEVAKLRQERDGDIVVHGSARLVQTLVEHDLVDEVRLMVFPVVLGSGKRLFDETRDKKPLRLVDSKVVGEGVAILIYEPKGEETKGSDSDWRLPTRPVHVRPPGVRGGTRRRSGADETGHPRPGAAGSGAGSRRRR
jgi:dihydrofolate reductase